MMNRFSLALLLLGTVAGFAWAGDVQTPGSEKEQSAIGVKVSNAELQKLLEQLQPVPLDGQTLQAVTSGQDMVLTLETILALRELQLQQDIAWKQQIKPPQLRVDNQTIEISTIQAPIQINVRNGYDTFIEFYDITGKPWSALADPSVGSIDSFDAKVMANAGDDTKSHTIRVSAKENYGDSTLTVHLKGVTETVNFRLVNNPTVEFTDFKRVFTLPMVNADAAERLFDGGQSSAQALAKRSALSIATDESMEGFLSMTPPVGAISIPVISGDAFAWLYKTKLYVRTQYETLQYPSSSNQQGLGTYFVHKTTPFPRVTYFSNGKTQVVVLDDEALMAGIGQQKRELDVARHLDVDFAENNL